MSEKLTFDFDGKTYTIDMPQKKTVSSTWDLSYKTGTPNGIGNHEDLTDEYKKLYNTYKDDLASNNKSIQEKTASKFKQICDGVAGRSVEPSELKTIIKHCQKKNPRMKINKYGHLFGRRTPSKNGHSDIWFKETSQ